jgi:hypothetical protein
VSIRYASFLVVLALVGCEEKKLAPTVDASTAVIAPIPDAAPAVVPDAARAATADAGADAAEAARFDPKHKCPTGQTHFYMEGDFCRRRCLSTSDCAGRERCSAMQYPFVVDGKPAGTARFCEGM